LRVYNIGESTYEKVLFVSFLQLQYTHQQRKRRNEMKTTYTAKFADGSTITRKSERSYAAAWRATWIRLDGGVSSDSGFSSSVELAAKAANPGLPYGTWRGMSAKDRANANEQNTKFLQNCNLKIEIVEIA
jgi:hypothetical protein